MAPSKLHEPGKTRDPELRAAILLSLAFTAFTLVVFTLAGFLRGPASFDEALIIGVPMMIVDGTIAFSMFFVLRWTAPLPGALRWSLVAAGVIVVAILQSGWDTQLRAWAGTIANDYRTPYLAFIRSATINTYNAGMYTALLAFQSAILRLRENRRLLLAAQASERNAHMLALRFQLNPHFLFNTLNAISSLVVLGRAADAEQMIERLSAFLRASLSADPRQLASIGEEFEMLETYLEIEAIRFGARLVPVLELPDRLADARMPPFLLQPLVENAIKYAVAPSQQPVEVRIAAEQEGETVRLTVADTGNGGGDAAPGTGVGLANVCERLRLTYGTRASIEKSQSAEGFRVTITLPLDLPLRARLPAPDLAVEELDVAR
jgi:signal transduction histidine kinase